MKIDCEDCEGCGQRLRRCAECGWSTCDCKEWEICDCSLEPIDLEAHRVPADFALALVLAIDDLNRADEVAA